MPFLTSGVLEGKCSVLDLGCGPGTNTINFKGIDYLGVDINESYITYARHRFDRPFLVADVTTTFLTGRHFDLVLVNSLFHHLDDRSVQKCLANIADWLAPGG